MSRSRGRRLPDNPHLHGAVVNRARLTTGLDVAWLEQGPPDGPLAICLHGFPDHASTWRHLLPRLARAGHRAVAPWLRGYAPTGLPPDGRADRTVLADDLVALHDHLRAGSSSAAAAVVIGHDWGAIAAHVAITRDEQPFRRAVLLAAPSPGLVLRAPLRTLPRQTLMSAYVGAFNLPFAKSTARRRLPQLIDQLWSSWSPAYVRDDVDDKGVLASLSAPGSIEAAIDYYRAMGRDLAAGRVLREPSAPTCPTLYLHGRDDGCISSALVDGLAARLGDPWSVEVIDGVGHFLHLERPEQVGDRILDFVGPA